MKITNFLLFLCCFIGSLDVNAQKTQHSLKAGFNIIIDPEELIGGDIEFLAPYRGFDIAYGIKPKNESVFRFRNYIYGDESFCPSTNGLFLCGKEKTRSFSYEYRFFSAKNRHFLGLELGYMQQQWLRRLNSNSKWLIDYSDEYIIVGINPGISSQINKHLKMETSLNFKTTFPDEFLYTSLHLNFMTGLSYTF